MVGRKSTVRNLALVATGLLLTGPYAVWAQSGQEKVQEKIFETNVTNDMNLSSGEPEIAIDPTNPRHIAVVEFATGSASLPSNSYNFNDYAHWISNPSAALGNSGRVDISMDGGDTWSTTQPPVYFERSDTGRYGGGDPIIAYGAHGELYAGSEVGAPPKKVGAPADPGQMLTSNVQLALSTDAGRTFSPQKPIGTPIDRPWLTVDLSTNTLYSVSSGPLNPKTGEHNAAGPDAPNDRWLVAWLPGLASKSEPRRLGGPDFSAGGGSTFAAAHGVVAATFMLGGPEPGAGINGAPVTPAPVPASLRGIMQGGVTSCSHDMPCLFFETSRDEGRTWARHHLVVPGGMAANQRPNVSADPGRPGRFAVTVQSRDRTGFLAFVTNDNGRTWSKPSPIPEAAPGPDFKPWMAYGPTGVLGMVWKKERPDFAGGPTASVDPKIQQNAVEVGFDVYATISCDGGSQWLKPVRVNAETSPRGVTGSDDMTYLVLDSHNAHMVWGDRRNQQHVENAPGASGGRQAYYGRVPFSVLSHGAKCGRS